MRHVGVTDAERVGERPAVEVVRVDEDPEVRESPDHDATDLEARGLVRRDPGAGDAVPAQGGVQDAHVPPGAPDGDRRAVDRPACVVDVDDDAPDQGAGAAGVAAEAQSRTQHRAPTPGGVDVMAVGIEERPAAVVRAGGEHDRPACVARERGVQLSRG